MEEEWVRAYCFRCVTGDNRGPPLFQGRPSNSILTCLTFSNCLSCATLHTTSGTFLRSSFVRLIRGVDWEKFRSSLQKSSSRPRAKCWFRMLTVRCLSLVVTFNGKDDPLCQGWWYWSFCRRGNSRSCKSTVLQVLFSSSSSKTCLLPTAAHDLTKCYLQSDVSFTQLSVNINSTGLLASAYNSTSSLLDDPLSFHRTVNFYVWISVWWFHGHDDFRGMEVCLDLLDLIAKEHLCFPDRHIKSAVSIIDCTYYRDCRLKYNNTATITHKELMQLWFMPQTTEASQQEAVFT